MTAAAWITALTAVLVAVLGFAGWAGRYSWRVLRRTTRFLDAFFGEEPHDGLGARPGVMARLDRVETALAHVLAETRPNGGDSLRDVVARTALDVAEIKAEQAGVRARLELMQAERNGREKA
jgi:hypothetical protein